MLPKRALRTSQNIELNLRGYKFQVFSHIGHETLQDHFLDSFSEPLWDNCETRHIIKKRTLQKTTKKEILRSPEVPRDLLWGDVLPISGGDPYNNIGNRNPIGYWASGRLSALSALCALGEYPASAARRPPRRPPPYTPDFCGSLRFAKKYLPLYSSRQR